MSKIKISVIVPCYNVEKYVGKCVESLVNQTLKGIEIILVNDGSTDNTLEILKQFEEKSKNIILLDKENAGVSIARNVALDKAKGEYIAFLDSDDWLEVDAFEKVYKKAKEGDYDLVAFDTNAVYPDYKQYISSNIKDNEKLSELMIDAYAVIWNKIYKRELIDDIRFKEGMNFCEDVLFLYMIYSRVNKVGAISEPLHFYLQRVGSLTYTYDKKLYQLVDSLDNVVDFYKKQKKFNKYKDEIEYSYVRYLFATFIKRLAKTKNREEFVKGYKYVKEKVNEKFPDYKSNKYLKNGKKGLYLKHFNRILAEIVYMTEKNKMN